MTQREVIRKRIRFSLAIAIVCILACYGAFQARNLALGPVISIATPRDGATSSTTLMTISGTAKNIAFMTLDDRPIYTDENGNFSEDIALARGYNIVTLYARDAFGKETTKTLELTAD